MVKKVIFYELLLQVGIVTIYAVGAFFIIFFLAVTDEWAMNTAERSLADFVDGPAEIRADTESYCAKLSNESMNKVLGGVCEWIIRSYASIMETMLSIPAYHLRNLLIEIKAGVLGTDVCYI